jgi:HD-like signal output (HDOD) protein
MTGKQPAVKPVIDHAKLGEQLLAIVQKRIATNTLVLPSLPTIALKCLSLIRSPNFSLKDASTIVEKDPLLAAQVMRAANSAAMATREPAKTILNALSRLGVDKLRTLLVEVSAHKVRVQGPAHRRGLQGAVGPLAGGGRAGAGHRGARGRRR